MALITDYAHGTFACPGYCSGDASSTKAFYSALLGWTAHDLSMPEGEYTMFKLDGNDVAGMYQMANDRKAAGVLPHWNSYLTVTDAETTAKKCETLGGKVLMKPSDMDGDVMANLEDPIGVKFSIWQAKKQPEPSLLDETGALCWTELNTRDTVAASAFYTALLDWRPKLHEGVPMAYTIFDLANEDRPAGGMMEIGKDMQGMPPQWLPYFQVEDADQTAERALELGGKVHGPMDIPTVGRIAIIADNQGAAFAVIKPI